jgi:hypothetical protein
VSESGFVCYQPRHSKGYEPSFALLLSVSLSPSRSSSVPRVIHMLLLNLSSRRVYSLARRHHLHASTSIPLFSYSFLLLFEPVRNPDHHPSLVSPAHPERPSDPHHTTRYQPVPPVIRLGPVGLAVRGSTARYQLVPACFDRRPLFSRIHTGTGQYYIVPAGTIDNFCVAAVVRRLA